MATSSSNDNLESINEAMGKAGNAKEQRSDLVAVLARDHDWGHFLTPAPLTVALLGEIMLVSTDTDFSLSEKPLPPETKLKYPDSFRASLLQVTHEGYSAFNMAHKNMDKIRLYTATVPGDFQEVVKILIKGSREDVEQLLPIPLCAIGDVAKQCLNLAQQTEGKFVDVMTLTADLLEALTIAKGQYKDKIHKVTAMRQIVENEKEAVLQEKNDYEDDKMRMADAVELAEETWKQSMDQMPDGLGILGAEMAGIISDSVKTVGRAITVGIAGVTNMPGVLKDGVIQVGSSSINFMGFGVGAVGEENNSSSSDSPTPQATGEIPSNAPILEIKMVLELSIIAVELLKNIGKKGKKLNKKQHEIHILAQGCKQREGQLSKLEESVCQYQALAVAKKGIMIADRLSQHIRSAAPVNKTSMNEMKAMADEMHKEAVMLNSHLTVGQGLTLPAKSLKQTQLEDEFLAQKNYDDSYAGRYIQSAQFKVEHAQANLNQWRDGYENACNRLKEKNKRYNELLVQLAELKIDEIDFDKIQAVMCNAIRNLASLREQWGTLVQFFQAMANLVEVNLNKTLNKFLKYAEQGEQTRLTGASMTSLLTDILYETTLEAVGVSHFVNMVSETYLSVSSKYIMPQISGLDALMALDAEKEKVKIQLLQTKMLNDCQQAQSEIAQLITTRMAEFNAYYNRRLNTIQKKLRAIVPPPDDSVKEAIATGIQSSTPSLSKEKKDKYLENFC